MRLSPARIALAYAVIAGAWIVLSDAVATALILDRAALSTVSTLKGWAFVLVTALLLLLVVRAYARDLRVAHDAARQSAEELAAIVEHASTAVIVSDLDAVIVAWNPAAERIYGYAAADVIGKPAPMIPPDRLETTRARIRRIDSEAEPASAVVDWRRPDGSPVTVRISGVRFTAADGRNLIVSTSEDVTEATAAERALAAAAERDRILFERNPLAMLVLEPVSRRILDANSTAQELSGRSHDELVGMSTRDLVPAEDRDPRGVGVVGEDLEDPDLDHQPRRLLRPDGTLREIEVTRHEVELGGRQVWLASLVDVTERRAEERRRQVFTERLELLRAIDLAILSADSSAELARGAARRIRELVAADRVVIVTFDLVARTATLLAADDTGTAGPAPGTVLPLDQIVDAAWLAGPRPTAVADLVASDSLAPSAGLARSLGMRSYLTVPLFADGKLLGQVAVGAARPDAFAGEAREIVGEVARVLAVALRQAQLRDAVADSEQRFRLLFDASPNAILLVDSTGRIRFANEAVIRAFGMSVEGLIGKLIETIVPLESRERHVVLREGYAERGTSRPHGRRDLLAQRHDGSHFPVDVALMPVQMPDGPMVVATIIDLSEREALERQLRQAQKMEVMGHFSNILAHDFRNYLTAIGGFTDLIAATLSSDDPRMADAEEIRKAVDQAADLVRNVLSFARPTEGEGTTQLDVLLHDTGRLLRRLVEPRARLELAVPDDLPAAQIDPAQLTQVLANLATNAHDAMPTGGVLRIEATSLELRAADEPDDEGPGLEDAGPGSALPELPLGSYVRVLVSDTGLGMDEATTRRVFEPFFSTKAPGVGTGRGSGLGLSSAYLIVTRAGGRIAVRSRPGRGTTFVVDLPAVA